MTSFYAPISSVVSGVVYVVGYTTLDSRRLTSVANTPSRIVLSGAFSYWTGAVSRQRVSNRCLNSVDCDPYHSSAKHCQMNTVFLTKHHAASIKSKCIVFSKAYLSQIRLSQTGQATASKTGLPTATMPVSQRSKLSTLSRLQHGQAEMRQAR